MNKVEPAATDRKEIMMMLELRDRYRNGERLTTDRLAILADDILRRREYDCFDASLTELQRGEVKHNIRKIFSKVCEGSKGQEPRLSNRIKKKFLELPAETVVVPMMVRGFFTAVGIRAFLYGFDRLHDFAIVGYSRGRHSHERFRDGSPVLGKVLMNDEDRDIVVRVGTVLLVDGAIQNWETVRTVTGLLLGTGAHEIHALGRHNTILALRQKKVIVKIHPALASVEDNRHSTDYIC